MDNCCSLPLPTRELVVDHILVFSDYQLFGKAFPFPWCSSCKGKRYKKKSTATAVGRVWSKFWNWCLVKIGVINALYHTLMINYDHLCPPGATKLPSILYFLRDLAVAWMGMENIFFLLPPLRLSVCCSPKVCRAFCKASSDDFQETSELSHILEHHEGFSLKTYCS